MVTLFPWGKLGINYKMWVVIVKNMQRSGHMGQKCQTELMVEIYSKSLVRAISKVLLIKFSKTPIKKPKGD